MEGFCIINCQITNGFSEIKFLGKGSYGDVYNNSLCDEDTATPVKVFNILESGCTRSSVVECKALRKARHRCLSKIVTCCSCVDLQGQ
jgi:hypothetical protein